MHEIVAINPSHCRFYTLKIAFPAPSFVSSTAFMAQINAYLTFNGNCREAMTFYKDCLGGELTMQTVQGSPLESQMPLTAKKHILHASLVNHDLVLLGSDMTGTAEVVKGNTISLSLHCGSADEIQLFFSRLSDGGQIVHPLHEFFAGTMGTLTDKFEKDWLLYYDKKTRRS